jgi:hypothetical protein
MFDFYEQQPASPLVEWFRHANRRAKDLPQVPKRFIESAATTLAAFVLIRNLVGETEAWEKVLYLLISLVSSVLIVPAVKWLFHFATAFHALTREEVARLTDDNKALSTSVAELRDKLDVSSRAAPAAPLQVEIPPERLRIQGQPPTVVVEPFTEAVHREGAKHLAALREKAIHELLNRKVLNENELATLKRDIDSWQQEVLRLLEQYAGVDEVTTFRVLGTYPVRATGGLNAEHNRELGMLWERVKRLERTITRLSR